MLKDISDTAVWAALYRARETERRDAVFEDPYAARLAGARGEAVARAMADADRYAWALVARTWLFDRFIERAVAAGARSVLNLGAGLDARPYRMKLPADLRWVEADLAPILKYKETVLRGDRPNCRLERMALDLRKEAVPRGFDLVISEGLVVYLEREEVTALARQLEGIWLVDICSPGLAKLMQASVNVPFKFAPPEGPLFFEGWRAEVRSVLQAGRKLGRLNWANRLLSYFPESSGRQGWRPWTGVCRLERQS